MKGGKQKTYANVEVYLQDVRPDVYNLYKKSGLAKRLRAGRLGHTQLVPDKTYTKKLTKLLNEGKGEVTEHLAALCIPMCLPTVDDWATFQKDIINKLRKKVVVENVSTKSVKIKSGELTVATDFANYETFEGRPNKVKYCVWNLKGEIDTKTPEGEYLYVDERFREFKKKPEPKKGGFAKKCVSSLQRCLVKLVRDSVDWAIEKAGPSPFRTKIAQVIMGLGAMSSEGNKSATNELEKLNCILNGNVAAEAFLVLNSPLFSASLVKKACKIGKETVFPDAVVGIYNNFMNSSGDYIASGQSATELANVMADVADDDTAFSNKIEELYAGIAKNNKVEGIEGDFICPEFCKYIWTLDEYLYMMGDTYFNLVASNTQRGRIEAANKLFYVDKLYKVTGKKASTLISLPDFQGDKASASEIRSNFAAKGVVLSFAVQNSELTAEEGVFRGGDEEEEFDPLERVKSVIDLNLNDEQKKKLKEML